MDTLEKLIQKLKDENPVVRKIIAETLGEIGDSGAVEPLITVLKKDKECKVREAAAWALGEIKNPNAVPALIKALEDDKTVRIAAIEALGKIKDKRAVGPLTYVLGISVSDSFVRKAAAWALGEIGNPGAVEILVDKLEDSDPYVCAAAAEALGKIKDPRAVEGLINVLDHGILIDVGGRAREALIKIGKPAVPELIKALEDKRYPPRWRINEACGRWSVVEALGEIGDSEAIPVLEEVLKEDKHQYVREKAEEALNKLRTAQKRENRVSCSGGNGVACYYCSAFPDLIDLSFAHPFTRRNIWHGPRTLGKQNCRGSRKIFGNI